MPGSGATKPNRRHHPLMFHPGGRGICLLAANLCSNSAGRVAVLTIAPLAKGGDEGMTISMETGIDDDDEDAMS